MKKTSPLSSKVENIREAYDNSAEFYDARYRYIQFVKYGIELHKIVTVSSVSRVELSGTVLDIGGGTGLFLRFLQDFSVFLQGESFLDEKMEVTFELARYLIQSEAKIEFTSVRWQSLVICDISFEMLRKIPLDQHFYGAIACDGEHLPFRDEGFSIITAFTVFQNMEDINKALKESWRVLKPNGLLAISSLEKPNNKREIIETVGTYFDQLSPVPVKEHLEDFQKIIVQNSKYSSFYDLEKLEDFFLTAKKSLKNPK